MHKKNAPNELVVDSCILEMCEVIVVIVDNGLINLQGGVTNA